MVRGSLLHGNSKVGLLFTTQTTWVRYVPLFGAIFVADCVVNSIGIGFPITWHPDELSKALQIQTETFSFYHPYLLLLLTKVAKVLLFLDDTSRMTVLTGRFVSVAATSAAVTILAIIVTRRFGIFFGL